MINNILILKNKKIKFKYKILNKFIAGLSLFKDEIKFFRSKNINMNNSYCVIINNEIFMNNFYIIKYKNNVNKSFKKRNIKLLLNKNEILKISKKIKINNYYLMPYKIFLKNNNLAKIVIYICKILKKKKKIKKKYKEYIY
ncbi:MAG: SsrA-binding protein [Candidatus Shikimatogenerans sp. Tcar]|uniref:SsrA-binding protein n=1 Tax=Candidatus Shikimatogenerans sp. Tcar TaxID=3158565 RepID=A0AAU7QRX8_9FLAO